MRLSTFLTQLRVACTGGTLVLLRAGVMPAKGRLNGPAAKAEAASVPSRRTRGAPEVALEAASKRGTAKTNGVVPGGRGRECLPSGISSNENVVALTHANLFSYALSFHMQASTMQDRFRSLGQASPTFLQMQTVLAVLQMASAPLFGRMGDLFGERLVLSAVFALASCSYLLTGLSDNETVLLLSRIPSLLMHGVQGSQMLIGKATGASDRTNSLSRLGLSYGIGMALGPPLGSYLATNYSDEAASYVATFLSLMSAFSVMTFIPDVILSPKNKSQLACDKSVRPRMLFSSPICNIIALKVLQGLPGSVLQAILPALEAERFRRSTFSPGVISAYASALSLLMQGIGVAFLGHLLSEHVLLAVSTIIQMWMFSIIMVITEGSSLAFSVLVVALTCSSCVANAILTSAVTLAVPPAEMGVALGFSMALHSAIRFLAPILAGYILDHSDINSALIACIASSGMALAALHITGLRRKHHSD